MIKYKNYAGVVELVDSVDLGSTARACRFESCCPHQKSPDPDGSGDFFGRQRKTDLWQMSGGQLIAAANTGGSAVFFFIESSDFDN